MNIDEDTRRYMDRITDRYRNQRGFLIVGILQIAAEMLKESDGRLAQAMASVEAMKYGCISGAGAGSEDGVVADDYRSGLELGCE